MSLRRLLLVSLCLSRLSGAAPEDYFGIHVIDETTGRGVPLITLKTTNAITLTTDSAGWIAFAEPGLMNRTVYFHVEGPGYAVPKDGFGYAGVKLTPVAGKTAEVKVLRTNIAERVCRLTGQGIYRDSTLLGKEPPLPSPNLFADVMGQDSVQVVPWKGRYFWIFGDTQRPGYPLGNFHSTAAWSDPPDKGGLDPENGIHFEYITDENNAVAKMLPVDEPGVVWLFGMLTVMDAENHEHLIAHYSRWRDLGKRLEHGLAELDESTERFRRIAVLGDEYTWQHPQGNAVRVKGEDGDWLYFSTPFCQTRVKADYVSVQNTPSYESLLWSDEHSDFVWQNSHAPTSQEDEEKLIAEKKMPKDKARMQVVDVQTGKSVHLHAGSVHWNKHRERWVMIAVQESGGVSYLGEVWYLEAKKIEGPWRKAVKIATHPKYSFYNPSHHAFFDQKDGRIIYFQGTYAETFSGNPVPTPRYDYNQLMYRLDLDVERLKAAREE
ncbi:hypothetical protein [Prosthecobacter sp.]|uniref:hypothetical protein n=1 Tax=Prosthecobacter sp. TaxID=1965333 RepID=UPI001D843F4E|nr:hypothetical protein [Prosthecobacter sp.]MCB1275899.1 hypothetical protein [Prosthecobacter sp.]